MRLLERTDLTQLSSSHPALAPQQAVNPPQKLQDIRKGRPNWQTQPSQAEHSLRDKPLASAEEQHDLRPLVGGKAQPDASQPVLGIQSPLFASVADAAAMPGVGIGGIQSTPSTATATTQAGTALQHVAAALEERPQPTLSMGNAADVQQPVASGTTQEIAQDVNQPAAAQVLLHRAPPPDGSAQPGQWRTKRKTATQADCSMEAACAAPSQHTQGACTAEHETELLQDFTRAQQPGAAEGMAALSGSRQCAEEIIVQPEDAPPWVSEQVTDLALNNVMAQNCYMGSDRSPFWYCLVLGQAEIFCCHHTLQ